MTHLNELIALELGWRDLRPAMANVGRGQSTGIPPGELRTYVPNWAGSLDLMWALQDKLGQDEREQYARELLALSGNDSVGPGAELDIWLYDAFEMVHATAEQKAIAWLKVKGVKP